MTGMVGGARGCARVSVVDVEGLVRSHAGTPPFPRGLRSHALVNRASVLVAMALLSDGGRCVTTTAAIAVMADVSMSTVRLSLRDLAEWDLVTPTTPRPADAPSGSRCVTISRRGLATARLLVRSMTGATRAGEGVD